MATSLQPPIQMPSTNNNTEEKRSQSPNSNGGGNTDEPHPSSLLHITADAGNSPLSSHAIVQRRDDSTIHSQPSPRVSLRDVNNSDNRLRTLNRMPPQSCDDGEGLRPLQSSDGDDNPLSNPFDSTSHSLQMHSDSLSGVKQVSFGKADIYEVKGNQSVNYNINTDSTILDRLAGYAMLDTTLDSSARDPPPRCHPGTRLSILRSIQEILRDPSKEALMGWLHGAAGVGKSAVMQTIAEGEVENNGLGASLFFSRPNNRDDPRKVFPTIAYQLAVKEPSYQQYLAKLIAVDPSFLNKTMDEQFNDLIIIPFAQQQILGDAPARVILLDGLDECRGSRKQCKIIELIHGFVSQYPSISLRWVIASRPEQHLRVAFSEVKANLQDSFWEKDIPVNSEQSVRDVELYLNNEFAKIRKRYPDFTAAYDTWPNETQFLIISRAASGLFVFASTIIRFIDDDDENPLYRLNLVTSFLEKRSKQLSRINPLVLLDALYEGILSEISTAILDTTKLILGCLVLMSLVESNRDIDMHSWRRDRSVGPGYLTPFWMCNVLGLEQHVLYGAVRKLRSVLAFPEPKDALDEQIQFFHASFSDYLNNPERSYVYSVNLDETTTYLFCRCMLILQQYGERHSYDVDYSWSIDRFLGSSPDRRYLFKRDFVQSAGETWPILLREHHNKNPDKLFNLSLSLKDIMKQLKQLDYSHEYSIFDIRDVGYLVCYLESEIPTSLSKDIIQKVSLASLDKTRFLKSVHARQWAFDNCYLYPFMDTSLQMLQHLRGSVDELEGFLRERWDDGHVFNVFNSAKLTLTRRLLEMTQGRKREAAILGTRPSKCRVVVQIRPINGDPYTYSFPYIA